MNAEYHIHQVTLATGKTRLKIYFTRQRHQRKFDASSKNQRTEEQVKTVKKLSTSYQLICIRGIQSRRFCSIERMAAKIPRVHQSPSPHAATSICSDSIPPVCFTRLLYRSDNRVSKITPSQLVRFARPTTAPPDTREWQPPPCEWKNCSDKDTDEIEGNLIIWKKRRCDV